MRVCIVGGGGYLGYVNFSTSNLSKLNEKLTTVVQGSLLDENKVSEALSGCESCFHLAAYGMSGIQAFNRELVFRINVDGTVLLMDYCKKLGVTRFIYTSSVGVIFTNKELVNVREDYPYPDESEYYSAYSASKAQAEKLVLAADCPELRTCALRLRGIYGPGEPRSTERAADIIHKGLFIAFFAQKERAFTQYSGINNVTHAMYKADLELSKKYPRCAGKAYHIVDANPVDSLFFWTPLITALSQTTPSIRIPFSLIYLIAYISEWLAVHFGIPPMINRHVKYLLLPSIKFILEVCLIGITNTYSIERAMKDFDYRPTNNHDLTEVVEYYKKYYEDHPGPHFDLSMVLKILLALAILLFLIFRIFLF
ncbi:3-beta hydroxysteroid dehydrogenase/isomerase family protein [Oesophagostomum dentatum]|uniref:3-beta hydroxysteroid dehydrogenase/isomerase family protein n=1 Tax=Oesophagostomum dentatum TaxID=61180 RepID=A0A0B1T7W9_OESDE|nr:3-beta hydroxysteroid dehydrogenase/isomerase family protein [Oesophagostomum dentatum]